MIAFAVIGLHAASAHPETCSDDRGDAGPRRRAVDMHGAGAAQRLAATELGPGHAEHVAQHPQQRGVAVDIDLMGCAVDLQMKAMAASGWLRLIGSSRPTWTAPAGCVHQWARVAHGRTRMTVFPARRSVALKVATASSRAETLPMFVRSRPSRTRWTISLSWARSDSTTKSTARPSAGRA